MLLLLKKCAFVAGVLFVVRLQSFEFSDETETEILSQALKKVAKEIIAPINQTINIITCNGAGNRLENLPKYLMKDLNNSMTFTSALRSDIDRLYSYNLEYQSATIVICDEWDIA